LKIFIYHNDFRSEQHKMPMINSCSKLCRRLANQTRTDDAPTQANFIADVKHPTSSALASSFV